MLGFGLCFVGIYFILCWIFEFWIWLWMIIFIILFGVIGMIWGYYLYGILLFMFFVVGFIGMVGIIINDSIVLVIMIDEYVKDYLFW